MRILIFSILLLMFHSPLNAEEGQANRPKPSPKYIVLLSEIEVRQGAGEPLTLEKVATDFERLEKKGLCQSRQSIQAKVSEDQGFDFTQRMEVSLLDRIQVDGGIETRIMNSADLGMVLRIGLTTTEEGMDLTLAYQRAFVHALSPDSKTTDLKTVTAQAKKTIVASKKNA